MTARRVPPDGLARDADVFELVSELAPLHPRDNTFPGEVFLRAAADALDWCGASRAIRCPWRGYASGSCPSASSAAGKLEVPVRGAGRGRSAWRDRTGSAGGGRRWQADDFWQYALFAAVAYIRAVASRAGVPVRQACQDLAQRPGAPAP